METINTALLNIKREDILPLFSHDEIQARIKDVAQQINKDLAGEEVCMICVLKGAVLFAMDLAKNLDMPLKMEFIRLSSYGTAKVSSGKVNAVDISLPDLNGKNVLIVEDIVDTGITARFLLDFINGNFKTKRTLFCSLLDKRCFRKTDVEPDYYCFEIDNKFIIGYGLDYEGYYRNLDYIGYVKL